MNTVAFVVLFVCIVVHGTDVDEVERFVPSRQMQRTVETRYSYNGTCGDNLRWTLSDYVLTVKGRGMMTNFTDVAPWNCSRFVIERIVLEEGVESIGDRAFYGCQLLRTMDLPSSLRMIGDSAFMGCTEIRVVEFNGPLDWIGQNAFNTCRRLIRFSIPSGVGVVSYAAFAYCENIVSVSIPESVWGISAYAFFRCNDLVEINIPKTVTAIGNGAFKECSSLETLIIPGCLDLLGNNTFGGCTSLMSLVYGGHHDFNATDVFNDCRALKTICVPLDYDSFSFCGFPVKAGSTCAYNHCYEAIYNNGTFVEQKMKDATLWEKRTNRCVEFQCDNKTGLSGWSLCNSSSSDTEAVCHNSSCDYRYKPEGWSVIVEMKYVSPTAFDLSDVVSIVHNLTGIPEKSYEVGVIFSSNGKLVNFSIFMGDDESRAEKAKDSIANCLKHSISYDECGIFYNSTSVYTVFYEDSDNTLVIIIVVSCVAGVLVLVVLAALAYIFLKKMKKRAEKIQQSGVVLYQY